MFVISYGVFPWQAYQPSLMFESKAIIYPQVKHVSIAPLQGRLRALPTNIRLGWKVLKWTNTTAY